MSMRISLSGTTISMLSSTPGKPRSNRNEGVPPRRRVIGRDADEAMHPGFGTSPAIGVRPGNLVGGGTDAAFRLRFRTEARPCSPSFRPADIHPRQHRSQSQDSVPPAPALIFEEGVVAISLAVQKRLEFLCSGDFDQRFQRGFGFGDDL